VARELQNIQESLLLYVHCQQLDEGGLVAQLEEIDQKLDAGGIPESSPVNDVVDRLRGSLKTSA